jgi:choline monooxygenase
MFAGFVIVCFDDDAAAPATTFRDLEDLLLHDHPQLPVMREVRRREAVLKANWKSIVENYLECYHCDVAHPSFGNFDMTTWKHLVHDGWSRQGRVAPDADDDTLGDGDIIGLSAWWQWPNTFWARALGSDTFVAAFHEPLAPNLTRQIRIVYTATGHEDSELRNFNDLFDDVFQEDVSVVESVQRGLASRGYRGGALIEQRAARAGWSEHAVHRFQDLVRRTMAAPKAA